jgi:hypothetical protein
MRLAIKVYDSHLGTRQTLSPNLYEHATQLRHCNVTGLYTQGTRTFIIAY